MQALLTILICYIYSMMIQHEGVLYKVVKTSPCCKKLCPRDGLCFVSARRRVVQSFVSARRRVVQSCVSVTACSTMFCVSVSTSCTKLSVYWCVLRSCVSATASCTIFCVSVSASCTMACVSASANLTK